MAIVALPDVCMPPTLVHRVQRTCGPVLTHHPSGRPWLVGQLAEQHAVRARNREIEVVVVGPGDMANEWDIGAAIRLIRSIADLDPVASELVESDALLFARQAGRQRMQGPTFLSRSLFWATIDGISLVCDEQRPLGLIAHAEVDTAVLIGRLTAADLWHPFALNSIWTGVQGVGPGEWLDQVDALPPQRRRWWRVPHADRRITELAPALKTVMSQCVAERASRHTVVSCDLSGGLDSTSLAFCLAETGKRLHTVFLASSNVMNRDRIWSSRAAHEVGSRHHVLDYDMVVPSLVREDSTSLTIFPEGPSVSSLAVASVAVLNDRLGGTGSTLHLNGHGGDALFGPVAAVPWSLVRSTAPRRFARTEQYRKLNRYRRWPILRMLARSRDLRADLRRMACSDFGRPDAGVAHHSRWVALPGVNSALTVAARDLLRRLAQRALDRQVEPLAQDRSTHQVLQYLVVHGATVRQMNLARGTMHDIRYDSPYLDRRIVDLALSLNISERASQLPAKPLLAAARPKCMSIDYFTRPDKGDYTAEVFAHHLMLKDALRKLFADGSILGEMELVSPGTLLRAIDAFSIDGSSYRELAWIGIAERWLRSVRATSANDSNTGPTNDTTVARR